MSKVLQFSRYSVLYVGILHLMLTKYFGSLTSHRMELSLGREVYGRLMDEIQYINQNPDFHFVDFKYFVSDRFSNISDIRYPV